MSGKSVKSSKTKLVKSSTEKTKTTDQFFGKPAFKRLCYAAGVSTVGKELYDNVMIATEQITYYLLRSACASSSLSSRKTLNENDLSFACQVNNTPLLSSADKIERIKIKSTTSSTSEKKKTATRATLSNRKIRFYQKESVGKIMFSSTPFIRKFKELMESRKDELMFSNDELPRMTKNFKVLLQLTVQTILIRIISSAYISTCLFDPKRKGVNSKTFKHATTDHFGGKIKF